jgi:tRNA1(Val) A37 N6-methylase TrmN6
MRRNPNRSETVRAETTDDAALGGRLQLLQKRRGHRFGHDAILLAAAVVARSGQHAVDLGSGVGAAGLALACRVPGLTVSLVEIDPELSALAAENIARNRMDGRVRAVTLDAGARAQAFTAAGLPPITADHILMNPPFNDAKRQRPSPDPTRRSAHMAEPALLATWLRAARRLLRPRGTLTLIWRADGLDFVLETLRRGFGGTTILPIHAARDQPAIRILVQTVKESRAPLALMPGFVLSDAPGRQSAEAEAILRGGGPLRLSADRQSAAAKQPARKSTSG